MTQRRPDLPALTGLRFLAATWVLLFHTAMTLTNGVPFADRLVSVGYLGVSLFFVLSGFILVYTYWREDGSFDTRTFWQHRIARVVPVYWLAWLSFLPFAVHRFHGVDLLRHGFLSATLLQAWAPTSACTWNCPGWSLSAEAFFYLLFPLLFVALRRWPVGLAVTAIGLWAAELVLASGTAGLDQHSTSYLAVEYNPFLRTPEFAAGMLAGLWFVRGGRLPRWLSPRVVGVLTVCTCIAAAGLPKPVLFNGLLGPVFLLLILSVATARGALSRTVAVRLGSASYALYLLHVPLYDAARQIAKRSGTSIEENVGAWMLYVIVTVGISWWVYRSVEEPTRDWLRRRHRLTSLAHLPAVPAVARTPDVS